MERLTERFSNGQAAVYGCGNNCKYDFKYCNNAYEDCPTINEIYEKLAVYEDLEEQGLLLKLPCKVGDFIHIIVQEYTECTPYKEQFDEYNCQGCECLECDSHKVYRVKPVEVTTVIQIVNKLKYFGKTVFLTRQEAEEKIKEISK